MLNRFHFKKPKPTDHTTNHYYQQQKLPSSPTHLVSKTFLIAEHLSSRRILPRRDIYFNPLASRHVRAAENHCFRCWRSSRSLVVVARAWSASASPCMRTRWRSAPCASVYSSATPVCGVAMDARVCGDGRVDFSYVGYGRLRVGECFGSVWILIFKSV